MNEILKNVKKLKKTENKLKKINLASKISSNFHRTRVKMLYYL